MPMVQGQMGTSKAVLKYSNSKGSERTVISRNTHNTPSDTYAAVVLP